MLLAVQEGIGTAAATSTEVARPQMFNGTSSRVLGFVTVYKLYIRIKMRRATVKKQIQ